MIHDLIFARHYAAERGSWLVVVTPPEKHSEAQGLFAGAVVDGAAFGGRTLSLDNGSKLSLVAAPDPIFVPPGTAFDVMFIGWGGSNVTGAEEMTKWRKAAQSTVTRA